MDRTAVALAIAVLFGIVGTAGPAWADEDPIGFKKGLEDESDRAPDRTPAAEAFLIRAYPGTDIPDNASLAARVNWAALNAGAHSAGSWQLIGPSKATYPSVLNPFLFDGAQYVASGRVTAMAISPNCSQGKCTLYVAAAGGGVWRTDKALNGSNWQYISSSFGTNAIGSLLMDPRDSSGNTLYAGTGEPNASADSEAGVGIYKTTDGGQTWALVPGSDIFFNRSIGQMALDNAGNLLVPIDSGVRGISSTGGARWRASRSIRRSRAGSIDKPEPPSRSIRPIVAVATARGSTTVKVDPTHAGVIYVNEFSRGVWRSIDNGATWTQIKTPLNAGRQHRPCRVRRHDAAQRKHADVCRRGQSDRRGREQGPVLSHRRCHRGGRVFTDMTTAQNIGYCTGQCWYDNVVYTPPGAPDVVYLGGSFSYGELHGPSNGRAWLLSTNGGAAFTDLTQDADPNRAEGIHPDEHAIVTIPGKPLQFITGSDGGVVRSDGKFADISYKCDDARTQCRGPRFVQELAEQRREPAGQHEQRPVDAAVPEPVSERAAAKESPDGRHAGQRDVPVQRLPGRLAAGDLRRRRPVRLQRSQRCAAFQYVHRPGERRELPQRRPDEVGDHLGADPLQPGRIAVLPAGHRRPESGRGRLDLPGFVLGLADAGLGWQPGVSRSQLPRVHDVRRAARLRKLRSDRPGWRRPISRIPSRCNYGPDRRGGAVAWIARASQNTGSLWAATSTGRVFITENASSPAARRRLEPGRRRVDRSRTDSSPRSMSIRRIRDMRGSRTAATTSNTPAQPGHVFEATWSGAGAATLVDRSYNLPDFPITAVVRDDVTGDLYASSDFGVMKLPNGASTWIAAGTGLPMVEVSGLTIIPTARILYAATHGRSAWSMQLP